MGPVGEVGYSAVISRCGSITTSNFRTKTLRSTAAILDGPKLALIHDGGSLVAPAPKWFRGLVAEQVYHKNKDPR